MYVCVCIHVQGRREGGREGGEREGGREGGKEGGKKRGGEERDRGRPRSHVQTARTNTPAQPRASRTAGALSRYPRAPCLNKHTLRDRATSGPAADRASSAHKPVEVRRGRVGEREMRELRGRERREGENSEPASAAGTA